MLRLRVAGAPAERVRLVAVSPPPDARVLTFEAALPPTGKAACNVTVVAGVGRLACA